MSDTHKNIEGFNPNKKLKVLTVFDNVIANMLRNKNRNAIVTALLIRGRRRSIYLGFITQSYFAIPKILD